jgi:hypothetical protein
MSQINVSDEKLAVGLVAAAAAVWKFVQVVFKRNTDTQDQLFKLVSETLAKVSGTMDTIQQTLTHQSEILIQVQATQTVQAEVLKTVCGHLDIDLPPCPSLRAERDNDNGKAV